MKHTAGFGRISIFYFNSALIMNTNKTERNALRLPMRPDFFFRPGIQHPNLLPNPFPAAYDQHFAISRRKHFLQLYNLLQLNVLKRGVATLRRARRFHFLRASQNFRSKLFQFWPWSMVFKCNFSRENENFFKRFLFGITHLLARFTAMFRHNINNLL